MGNSTDFRIIVVANDSEVYSEFIQILTSNHAFVSEKLNRRLTDKQNLLDQTHPPKFVIDAASDRQECITRIQLAIQEKRPYALAFVDAGITPDNVCIEMLKQILETDLEIQLVICTTNLDFSWEQIIAHLGHTDNIFILKKPFESFAVWQLTCALTKKWQLKHEAERYVSTLEQKSADNHQLLQHSISLVKATLDSSSNGILVVSEEGIITDCNQKLLQNIILIHSLSHKD